MYHAPCTCGNRIPVELFQAGLTVNCTLCGAAVTVPTSIELKRLVGDRDPFLSLADKVTTAAMHRAPPFDGRCHGCREADADHETSVALTYLDEREVDDDGGIILAPGFLRYKVGAARETWRQVVFPLQLCSRCMARFNAERPGIIQRLFASFAYGVFLLFAFLVLFVVAVALHSANILLVGALALGAILTYWFRKRGPEFVLPWLELIPFAGDLIRAQDEYRIRLGKPTPYSRSEIHSLGRGAATQSSRENLGNGNSDRRNASIVVCPRCVVTVLPTRDGQCPSCRNVIADA